MRRGFRTFALLIGLALLASGAPPSAAAEDVAWVKREGSEIGLGNKSLELWLQTAGNRCTAVRLANHLAKRTIPLKSDDFSLGIEGRAPLKAADFAFKDAREESMPGGKRLVLRFENSATNLRSVPGVQLAVVYELGNADFFIRRRLELAAQETAGLAAGGHLARRPGGKVLPPGLRRAGIPGRHLLGRRVSGRPQPVCRRRGETDPVPRPQRRTASPASRLVLGVGEPGRVARRFQKYVETFRDHPPDGARAPATSLFVNYNTWWTLMPPTEKNCLELIDLFKRKLFDPYGESIDTFTLDDGWDVKNSLWDIDPQAFPPRFRSAGRAARGDARPAGDLALAFVRLQPRPLAFHPRIQGQQQPVVRLPIGPELSPRHRQAGDGAGHEVPGGLLQVRRLLRHLRRQGPRPSPRPVCPGGQRGRLHRAPDGGAPGAAGDLSRSDLRHLAEPVVAPLRRLALGRGFRRLSGHHRSRPDRARQCDDARGTPCSASGAASIPAFPPRPSSTWGSSSSRPKNGKTTR